MGLRPHLTSQKYPHKAKPLSLSGGLRLVQISLEKHTVAITVSGFSGVTRLSGSEGGGRKVESCPR